jgi:KaiC/GvpD/RAD55 family RecA-like ATPase
MGMLITQFKKIPSGIKTLDANINDGFPAGSVILLLEDVGAGAREFIYTSIFNIINLKSDSRHFEIINKKHMEKSDDDEINTTLALPGEIYYISLSRSREDILYENAYAFHKDFYNNLKEGIVFKELSDIYFRNSIIQNSLIKEQRKLDFGDKADKNMLEEISELFDTHASNNIVILDSLTELILYEGDYLNKNDIIMFLKSLVRISKTWNGLIYLILSKNILDLQTQEIINDIVDGVLTFEWFAKKSVKMQRGLYITKFRGLLPRLEQNNIEKFDTRITSDDGFEVSNIRKII